jgi:hypothetical protein
MLALPATHAVLGPLSYDAVRNTYEGVIQAGQQEIALCIKPDKGGDFANADRSAQRFAADAESECLAVCEFLAERYLERLNGAWRPLGRKTVSYASFVALVRPEAVTFRGDGAAEFYCGGGRLFEGHYLIVRSRSNGTLFDAEIAG